MIALADNLPLVRLSDSRAVRFERHWLERAVADAAGAAGYDRWWLAPHVAESVTSYLEREFDENVIASQCLHTLVSSVLQVIGYPDVARGFRLPEPPVRISLAALAETAGTGYELAFFRELDRTLHRILATRTARVEFCDLAACVKRLRRARAWRKDCAQLRNEIVAHVRGQAARLGRRRTLDLELT
ncbi:MAG: hypothetical protein FGM15_08395 [Chthoniobacterales bacterium]|nr:hypothetical protein [Chthoniobacterales bacterium]